MTNIPLDNFVQEFTNYFLNIDFTPIFPAITEICRASVTENFSKEGRYGNEKWGGGSQKWKKSTAAESRKGQTLSATGHLKQSIEVNVKQTSNGIEVIIGSNLPYAAIHNFGFDRGKLKMPERPYLVLQEEDIEDIQDIIMEYIAKELQG